MRVVMYINCQMTNNSLEGDVIENIFYQEIFWFSELGELMFPLISNKGWREYLRMSSIMRSFSLLI